MKNSFSKITIKIASASKIINWSYGEVKSSQFINYKNLKPEKNGLFCLNIFSDCKICCNKKKCFCNKNDKFLNLKKSHIGYKMGHILLKYPVYHIWFFKSNNLSNILNFSNKILEKIFNFKLKIILRSFEKKYKKYDFFLIEKKILNIVYLSGAKSINFFFSDNEILLDCKLMKKKILNCFSYIKLFYYLKKINKIYIFYLSGNKLSWCILKNIPVIPPRMRPLVPLNFEKFASSDINELYKKIIDRNLRIYKLIILGIPKQILINERILLQESVNALYDNEKIKNPILSSNKRILKSLSSSIKGKYGRFRQNLLGKRVDFSGRSVIVVDPSLLIFQCKIPILICLELFKPFLFYELKKKNLITTISFIDYFYKKNKKITLFYLNKIIKNHTILLNRAPTLHRMGFQSFEIILTEDKVIKLHPLMCLSYNADFDGDQMAIHLPLTVNSQLESKFLLLSINNLISPSNGEFIIIPSQDIIMGIYYLTFNFNNFNNFFSFKKIIYLYNIDKIDIYYNIKTFIKKNFFCTSVGRIIFYSLLNYDINFFYLNKVFKKKDIIYLIKHLFNKYNLKKFIYLLDKIKKIGFYFATISGLTISYDDLSFIQNKSNIFKVFKKLNYNNLFNNIEVFNNIFLNLILKNIKKLKFLNNFNQINNLFVMLDSGSRGSMIQIKQLIAFRGFFSKSNGELIYSPVLNNLKFGLTMKDYFVSTYGARKGLTDTSLKTANSGYLTRKLIDVMQDLVVYKIDCMTKCGIEINVFFYKKIKHLYKKIYGRLFSKDIYKKNNIFFLKNTFINNKIIFLLIKKNINKIFIRSVLFCISIRGVCVCCYGIDLSTNNIVKIGTPVGIISAQSIGEPGTQLTMRTFHTGGIASYFFENDELVLNTSGFIYIKNCKCVLNKLGKLIILSLKGIILIKKNFFKNEYYKIIYGDIISIRNGIFVKNKLIINNDNNFNIFSENNGNIFYNYKNLEKKFCINDKKYYFKTLKICILFIDNKKYFIPKNYFIINDNNQYLYHGDIIAKIIKSNIIKSNIIGGLPRISELFEARTPKKKAILSELDGLIHITLNLKNNYVLSVISKFYVQKKYILNCNRKIYVNNGDYVKIGDILTDGKIDLNDIIKFIGLNYLLFFFIKEINDIYTPQGVYINDKHLELVLKQMTKKIKVIYPGDCCFMINDSLYLEDVLIENILTLKNSKKICLYEKIVTGITKASLESNSFFSAASFQETNKILIDSAIKNRSDYLLGLKENVVVGKPIPAGTGLEYHILNFKKKSKMYKEFIKRKSFKLYI
ncbi:RNA polymerase beta' subunit [Candidatus Carsonella ruddii CS isolate Thao2000]|uniref:DNA-directed RNA polymerase subunit beta' n=1 Tax=Candidatus Carsonella ruddii CS isolate Thao2000 TaxID=1202537 RepID=J7GTH0_CARRU|nr:DNA-directed RNA polymerase subunit beta' [Candidatus Carsonella ruddii]AFP83834.1 RNA polymerase beta' subunit [Candidatus Carsonella ruddii CS isolate Thao2000]